MIHYTCDSCGTTLHACDGVRYEVTIEVKAACDPEELAAGIGEDDLEGEFEHLIEMIESQESQELVEEVYKTFRYDLCGECKRSYAKDPLLRTRVLGLAVGGAAPSFSKN